MLIQKLRERVGARLRSDESGFTLVELLVVMLIIGILAAIAIPSFFNQRDKANDAQAKAAVRTAQTAMETYATDNDGSYAGASVDLLRAIEDTLNDATFTVGSTASTYTITASSDTTPVHNFTIARAADGTVDYSCTPRGEGGCPNDSDWND